VVAVGILALQKKHARVLRQLVGRARAGDAGADDQDVEGGHGQKLLEGGRET